MRGGRIGIVLLWALLAVAVAASCFAAYRLIVPADSSSIEEVRTRGQTGPASTPETTRADEGTGMEATERPVAAPERTTRREPTVAGGEEPAEFVTAVGDSAMLGAIDALTGEVPRLALADAEGSRQAAATIDLLRQYRAKGRLGDAVIVHVGNNGPFTAEEFDEMMRVLAETRRVLVVNLTVPPNVPDPIAVPNDVVLAEGVKRHPDKAVLVDWYAASAGHPEYFWDGIHLTPDGARAYAELVSSQLGELEGSGKTPQPLETYSWGDEGASGTCVGPPAWCLEVVRR